VREFRQVRRPDPAAVRSMPAHAQGVSIENFHEGWFFREWYLNVRLRLADTVE